VHRSIIRNFLILCPGTAGTFLGESVDGEFENKIDEWVYGTITTDAFNEAILAGRRCRATSRATLPPPDQVGF